MDLLCICCGEPWAMDHVLHEEPELFERKGGVIYKCPCCKTRKTKMPKDKAQIIQEMGALLGDDVDGLAAELEDLGLV